MVIGSSWSPDEEILIPFINNQPDIKFVVAPHEMETERIERLERELRGGVVRYSQASDNSNLAGAHVLIIDTIGILNQLYQYAQWAYIGGGFGVCIHNTQEPATYGMPIAFGPNYHKFKEARDMLELGACCCVETTEDIERWFASLKRDEVLRQRVANIASEYIHNNCGATDIVVEQIFSRSNL